MALPATEDFTGTAGNKINTLSDWDGAGVNATDGLVIASNEAEADKASDTTAIGGLLIHSITTTPARQQSQP